MTFTAFKKFETFGGWDDSCGHHHKTPAVANKCGQNTLRGQHVIRDHDHHLIVQTCDKSAWVKYCES